MWMWTQDCVEWGVRALRYGFAKIGRERVSLGLGGRLMAGAQPELVDGEDVLLWGLGSWALLSASRW